MVIVKTLPLEYQYSPMMMQGLEMPNIFTMQGIEHIMMVLSHGGQTTQIGKYLTCAIEGIQLECGLFQPIFALSYKKYEGLVTDSTLKFIWKFITSNGLDIDTLHEFPKNYVNMIKL